MKKKFPLALRILAVAFATAPVAWAQTSTAIETTTTAPARLNSAGTITAFGPDTISVSTEGAPAPVVYQSSKTTTYVDETGAPVSVETVRSGLPATVYYTQVGDQMVASRVVVRRATTTTAPVVEEKKTTTTTTTEQ